MILLGRYLSPFVRRVAATLELYGLPFENNPLQHTGDDAPKLRELNPVGRVPALILDDERIIVDSHIILDYLDRHVGPDKALTPVAGEERDRVLNVCAIATGAVEKAIATAYEIRFRPKEMRHAPWVERCTEQAIGGFTHLEGELKGDWFSGDVMTQADVTAAVTWQFAGIATPKIKEAMSAPRLDGLVERMMSNPAYAKTLPST
ncbi:MAG: glutathione S-transferase family protein [Chromatiales bacterium]|jgi:glutathione S-transferase|nr:glutathione S-transferase family protein [Chromatiales bacterium]